MRTSRGGLEYRSRDERPLTSVLPVSPAAVRVYGLDGCCASLFLDLDVSRGGAGAVADDQARLTTWLTARGARVITDRSPTGGVHIYVPLVERTPYESAREVVEALAAAHPTLDASPHRSLKTGCVRPPGAAHKRGGHQELTVPLAAAYDALRRRNPASVLEAIRTDLRTEIAAWRALQAEPAQCAGIPAPQLDHGRPARALGARLRAIAEHGTYDTARYGSPSEARHAVVAGAVAAGWALADVGARLADGRWPGLAGLYARYSPSSRRTALAKDWHRAHAFVERERNQPAEVEQEGHVRRSHTSPSKSHGGVPGEPFAEHDHIRTWRTLLRAVELHRFPGRGNHLTRFVLRALGEAAHKTSSRYVAFGTRSLAVATGADHSSVAAALRRLAQEPDGWLDLIEPARGEHADLYELTVPVDLAEMARDLGWDRGRAHALRPVFRELGHVAAFVFEAVENQQATTITELVNATGMSRSAIAEAVDVLAAYGLVDRSPVVDAARQLIARPHLLTPVAELLGTLDAVMAQLRQYSRERAAWRVYLTRFEDDYASMPEFATDYWWPPDDASPAGALLLRLTG